MQFILFLGCASGDYYTEGESFLDFVIFSDFGHTVNIAGVSGGDRIFGEPAGEGPLNGFEVEFSTEDDPQVDVRLYNIYYPRVPEMDYSPSIIGYTPLVDVEEHTLLLSRTSLRGLRAEVGGDPETAFYVRLENLGAADGTSNDDLLITFIDVDDGTVLDEVLLY